jgi:hypothetical protein
MEAPYGKIAGKIDDNEVISIMVNGGEQLCDHALECWIGDKYKLGEEMRQAYIQRWGAIKRRIRKIANQIKSMELEG